MCGFKPYEVKLYKAFADTNKVFSNEYSTLINEYRKEENVSTNITKLSGAYLSNQINVNAVSQTGNVAGNADASFSCFLKSDTQSQAVNADNNSDLRGLKSDNSAATKGLDEAKKAIREIKDSTPTDEKKSLGDTKEAIDDASKEVFDAIKEQTGVSDEELIAAMEVLGLTMADLLDVSKVSELFLEIKGADSAQLLTDEVLLGDLNELIATVEEVDNALLDELGMSKEEFDIALAQAVNVKAEDNDAVKSEVIANVVNEEEVDNTDSKEKVATVSANDKKVANETTAKTEDNAKTEKTADETVTVNVQRREDKGSDNHENAFANNNQNNSFDFVEKLDETMNTTSSYVSQSAREIVNQIVEQVRIDISNENSRMELELNPASLGHVGLTIEAKAGVITASFTAQNEMVKEAIESQIVQLRENIEAQGVKIEAVEVTVASHAFEQNLQQNNKGASEEEERNDSANKAARRMRINLDEIDEEELTDGEKITKEMMEAQGNSVNVTA